MQPNMQLTMRSILLRLLIAGLALGAHAHASSAIYLCVGADGQRELTDSNRKGGTCKLLDLPGAISEPAKGRAGGGKAAPATTPADFPRVNDTQQKARDADRKQILQDELGTEQRKLEGLKAEYKDGQPDRNGNERNYAKYQERTAQMKDNIDRTEKNIDALNREIGSIK